MIKYLSYHNPYRWSKQYISGGHYTQHPDFLKIHLLTLFIMWIHPCVLNRGIFQWCKFGIKSYISFFKKQKTKKNLCQFLWFTINSAVLVFFPTGGCTLRLSCAHVYRLKYQVICSLFVCLTLLLMNWWGFNVKCSAVWAVAELLPSARLASPVHSVLGSSVGGEAAPVGRPVLLLLLHFHSSAPTTNMETVLRCPHVSAELSLSKTCCHHSPNVYVLGWTSKFYARRVLRKSAINFVHV